MMTGAWGRAGSRLSNKTSNKNRIFNVHQHSI